MLIGLPEITVVAGTETLSQVDLVAVPGTDVMLHGGKTAGVAVLIHLVCKCTGKLKNGGGRYGLTQPLQHLFTPGLAGDQPAALLMVILNQSPVIQAAAAYRQPQCIGGYFAHRFQNSSQVIAPVAYQPTEKRQ